MSTEEYILIFGGLFVALCFLLVCLNGRLQKIRQEKRRKNVIRQMLQTAQEQNEIFDLKVLDNETNKKGLSATLLQQDAASLDMEVLAYVSKEWTGTPVDVYFRVSLPEGPIFYKFRSAIQTVEAGRIWKLDRNAISSASNLTKRRCGSSASGPLNRAGPFPAPRAKSAARSCTTSWA